MAGEDLIVPAPPIGPADLGLPDPPVAPPPPALVGTPQPDFRSKLLRLLTIGTAAGLGPGAGTGLLRGLQITDAQQQQQRDKANALATQTYQYQQQQYNAQARLYDSEATKRQAIVQANVDQLRRVAPTLKTKDAYDQYINAFSAGLQQQGIRIQPNWLRQAVPYVTPSAKDEAAKVMDAFLKNPTNKAMIENHPEQIDQIVLRFDRDGDGTPENVKLTDLATIAEMPFATDDQGHLIVYPKGTTADAKASADGILQTLVEQAQAEGKQITPALKLQLQQQAIKLAAQARPPRPSSTSGQANQDDITSIADAIQSGDDAPDLARLYGKGAAVRAELDRRHVKLRDLQLQWQAAQAFTRSLNSNNMLRFRGLGESVVNTINEVRRLGDELKQGGLQAWNRAKRGTILQVWGNSPQSQTAAQYLGAINTLKEEFANLIQGGFAPTEAAFALANQQVNADFGVKDLDASLSEVQRLINYRLQGFNQLEPAVPGGTGQAAPVPPPNTGAAPGKNPFRP